MTSPRKILEQRGIYEQAIQNGWQEGANGGTGWDYPIPDIAGKEIARRSKAYDSKAKFKYGWIPSKPDNPQSDYYVLPGTLEAIAAADGVCFLANGEASVLAMRAAGIYNVFATCHGENTIPKSLPQEIELLGITKLVNIADKDEAGLKAAVKWRDATREIGVGYQAKQWPAYLPEKADFNDLFIYLNFDIEATQKALASCEALLLPQPEVKRPKKPFVPVEFDKSNLIAALKSALEADGRLSHRIFKGVWQQCNCPFHGDKKPSAGFNLESGVINCMGGCGKGISPKALAEHYGIAWEEFYPKQEGKKGPSKADLSRFGQALDKAPAELSYEDAIREEMEFRVELWELHRQYVGFGQLRVLPQGFVSAVMTLCEGRSNTAIFIGRLMDALLSGKLPTVFNLAMLSNTLYMSYDAVSKGVFEAEHLNFLAKLSGYIFSIDSMPSKETPKNSNAGRPCDWYMVELDKQAIIDRLFKLLSIYSLQKVGKKSVNLPTLSHALQLGLTDTEYEIWWTRAKAALEDPVNKAAKRAYDYEMHGGGKADGWCGWEKFLNHPGAYHLCYFDYESSLDLRAAIVQNRIIKQPTNSRETMRRLLGCSDPILGSVYERAGVLSLEQGVKIECDFNTALVSLTTKDELKNEYAATESFHRPSTVAGMESLVNHFQREKNGKIWKVSFLVRGEQGWQVSELKGEKYKEDFAKYNGRIIRILFLMTTPSQQRRMTPLELAARDAILTGEKASKVNASQAITPKTEGEKVAASQAETISDSDKSAYVYTKWDSHSYVYSYAQLRNLVYSFTMHELKGLAIVDISGNVLAQGELKELYQWALPRLAEKPVRKMKGLIHKGYSETDMAELEAFAKAQLERLGVQEAWELEEKVEDLPIFADMPKQAVMALPVVKPVPVIVPVKPATEKPRITTRFSPSASLQQRLAEIEAYSAVREGVGENG